MNDLQDGQPQGEPILLPLGTVRKVGSYLLVIGLFASIILTLGDNRFFDVIPAAWLGYFLTVVSLSIIIFPRLWQKRISRRMDDVSKGNWSGKRR